MGVTVQRAVLAFGFGFAEILADAHDQGVVFIEELDVLGQVGLCSPNSLQRHGLSTSCRC